MSKNEKAKKRILNIPSDYQYLEARYLLGKMGFEEFNKGKTSGSRVKFYREKDGRIVMKDNVLEYKGYYTLIRYDAHARKLRGVINGIDDYVDFPAIRWKILNRSFIRRWMIIWNFARRLERNHARFIKEYSMYGYSLSFIGN